jgi:hypothetical protein
MHLSRAMSGGQRCADHLWMRELHEQHKMHNFHILIVLQHAKRMEGVAYQGVFHVGGGEWHAARAPRVRGTRGKLKFSQGAM